MEITGSILLIDDSEPALELTRVVFEDAGYSVRTSTSSEEALTILEKSQLDAVICELHMPELSGLEFVSDPIVATSGVPVILQSSEIEVSTVLEAVRGGAFEFVLKTEDLEPLIAATRRACAHHRVVLENRSLRASMEERLSEAQRARDALEQEVSERRRAERELAEAHRRASEASSAKSHFLASMSHELRTPLTAIIGYTELVREELEDMDVHDVDGDISHILGASRHLLSLVNEILDLSRIESGRLETNIEPVAVQALVEDVGVTVGPLAAKKNNAFTLDISDHLGVVFTDAGRVRQVLLNLLGNAFKFTADGQVTLSVRRIEGSVPTLVFDVNDTGIGMTHEQCTRVFEPFVQAEASTASRYGGSGLGLSISRQLCRLLGGDLSVVSERGVGSTFTATIPVVPGALVPAGKSWRIDRLLALIPPGAEPSRDPESWEELVADGQDAKAIARERRVSAADAGTGIDVQHLRGEAFIVEDDPVVRVILERGLAHQRCRVRAFADGEGFLSELEVHKPSLVVLDLNLPGIDGFSLVDRLTERIPEVPIIVLTGQSLDSVQLPFLARRCAAVLTKHHSLESGAVTAIRLAVELLRPQG